MRYLTMAKEFPADHPRRGEPTLFVEKIMESIAAGGGPSKHHTVRAGEARGIKTDETISLRVWSGKPMHTPQSEIAKVKVRVRPIHVERLAHATVCYLTDTMETIPFHTLAENDGLSDDDMLAWLNLKPGGHFEGKLVIWGDCGY